ncbi:unnamed protein product [Effrenium voratum]|nr:unnamed protein product [Effrenium voratum]
MSSKKKGSRKRTKHPIQTGAGASNHGTKPRCVQINRRTETTCLDMNVRQWPFALAKIQSSGKRILFCKAMAVQMAGMDTKAMFFRPPPGLESFGPGNMLLATPTLDTKEEPEAECCISAVSTAPSSPAGSFHPQVLSSIAAGKGPLQLQLQEMVPEEPASLPWPSLGSAAHALGLCKPCDFQHRTSCRAGYKCQFCHLCPAGENRRRKKQKQAAAKLCRRMEQAGIAAPTVTELVATLKWVEKADSC